MERATITRPASEVAAWQVHSTVEIDGQPHFVRAVKVNSEHVPFGTFARVSPIVDSPWGPFPSEDRFTVIGGKDEHERDYDPERDDFEDYLDTPDDYEGDREADEPESCAHCGEDRSGVLHDGEGPRSHDFEPVVVTVAGDPELTRLLNEEEAIEAAIASGVYDRPAPVFVDEPDTSWTVDTKGFELLFQLLYLALKDGVGSVGIRKARSVWGDSQGNYGRIRVHSYGAVDNIPFERVNVVADFWHWQEREV